MSEDIRQHFDIVLWLPRLTSREFRPNQRTYTIVWGSYIRESLPENQDDLLQSEYVVAISLLCSRVGKSTQPIGCMLSKKGVTFVSEYAHSACYSAQPDRYGRVTWPSPNFTASILQGQLERV